MVETMMRGVEIADKTLRLTSLPRPKPQAGEVLVRVAYAGVNRADLLQVEGSYPPPEGASPLPGMEVSGTIVGIGPGVSKWQAGMEVCALLAGGGYAEYACVPAAQLLTLPYSLGLQEAASLPEAAATAAMALSVEAKLQSGEKLLLHGGTSGVGLLMAQIAKAWGAEVYTTVSGPEKLAFMEKIGIRAIDHNKAPFAQQLLEMTQHVGVDVVIDTLGGPELADHFKLLKSRGRMVSLALLDGNIADAVKLSGFFMKNLRWSAATLRSRSVAEKAEIIEIVRARVWPHLKSGAIKPVVDSVFPLEQAQKAHARMQERLHMGKILLEVAP